MTAKRVPHTRNQASTPIPRFKTGFLVYSALPNSLKILKMKNLFTPALMCLLFLVGSASLATAQSKEYPSNVIKINPLSLFLGAVNVQFEHKTGEKQSVQLGAYYFNNEFFGTRFSGFAFTPEYRFYLTDNSTKGLFVGPYVRYESLSVEVDYTTTTVDNNGNLIFVNDKAKATGTGIGGGGIIGYQWQFGRFALEPYFGLGFSNYNYTYRDNATAAQFNLRRFESGIKLSRVGMSIGLTF
jgi:hypothetical protein